MIERACNKHLEMRNTCIWKILVGKHEGINGTILLSIFKKMGCEVDSYDTGCVAVVDLCECCNEASRSVKDG